MSLCQQAEHAVFSAGQLVNGIVMLIRIHDQVSQRRWSIEASPKHGLDSVVKLLLVISLEDQAMKTVRAGTGQQLRMAAAAEQADPGQGPELADVGRGTEAVQTGQ